MFEGITKNFGGIIDKIRGRKFISEDDLNETLREIRIAMLEADVSLPIVKDFIAQIREKALGQQVIKNVQAGQMIVKIVNDELLELLGKETSEIDVSKAPTIIMMAGLQGSGKTTSAAKLALRLKNKQNKKVLLVSLDIYRPAAQQQLETLAKSVSIDSLEIIPGQKPIEITKRALEKKNAYDVIILDTAGRLQIDEDLMNELKDIKDLANPSEILLVGDSLMGQESVNVAKEFNEKVGITGIILTRIDGDGRGGAALSMKMVTGVPIKYLGLGEKIDAFEEFHPDRIASRILDMGDIVSFVEKAEEIVSKKEAEELEKKLKKGNFDLDDLLKQLKTVKKLGGIGSILSFLPGAGKLKEFIDGKGFNDSIVKKQEAIIMSMTPKERKDPSILNSSRKFRIVAGSGTTIQEVNSLLKKFKDMKKVVEKIGGMDKNQIQKIMGELGGNNIKFKDDEA